MAELTAEELRGKLELKNSATLTRWHSKEGLIPPPEVRPVSEGRGRRAYWPEWVLFRCMRIKQMRKEGKSLAEIRDHLGCDWDAEQKKYEQDRKHTYNFAEDYRRRSMAVAHENLLEDVNGEVFDWIFRRRSSFVETRKDLVSCEMAMEAVKLMTEGINPVLVLTSGMTYLTADFVVSMHLADLQAADECFMVIPISRKLAAYAADFAKIPDAPTTSPVARVKVSKKRSPDERDVCQIETWGFEIAAGKPKPVKKKKAVRRRPKRK